MREVERNRGFFSSQFADALFSLGGRRAAQVMFEESKAFVLGREHLMRHATLQHDARTQPFLAGHQAVQRRFQGRTIQPA